MIFKLKMRVEAKRFVSSCIVSPAGPSTSVLPCTSVPNSLHLELFKKNVLMGPFV